MASKKETASTTPESEVVLPQAESEMISPQTEAETLPEPVLSAEESPAVQDPGVAPRTDLGQDDIAGMASEDDVEGIRMNDDYNNRIYIIEDTRELSLVNYDTGNDRPARVLYTLTKSAPNPVSMPCR